MLPPLFVKHANHSSMTGKNKRMEEVKYLCCSMDPETRPAKSLSLADKYLASCTLETVIVQQTCLNNNFKSVNKNLVV
jgi:hypothetical protein